MVAELACMTCETAYVVDPHVEGCPDCGGPLVSSMQLARLVLGDIGGADASTT